MKKYILILVLLFNYLINFSQNVDTASKFKFQSEINKLNIKIKSIEKIASVLRYSDKQLKKKFDSLHINNLLLQSNISDIRDSLDLETSKSSNFNKQNIYQINSLNKTINARTLYWIVGIFLFLLLITYAILKLQKNISSRTDRLNLLISKTNSAIEKESIKLDSKLVEILQTQLLIKREKIKADAPSTSIIDHKLALKVGEEIHRMRKRIENMPQDLKGISALTNSLARLEEEFNYSGYTMEDLLGKKYVEGMKVEARFVDNQNISKGQELITEIIRPEVKYHGIVIQVAKVEVGKSY
jgi:hypothetical protein